MQQGGALPIQAPMANLGQTSPMIFQAASQPIDSGVNAAVQFSQLAQRRTQHHWQKYAFEVQREAQERGMDLARDKFEWAKATWAKEFDFKTRQLENQENLAVIGAMLQMDSGIKSIFGEQGIMGAISTAKTGPQVKAITDFTQKFFNSRQNLGKAMGERDKGAITAAFGELNNAMQEVIPANIQIAQMVNQSKTYWEKNGEGNLFFNTYLFNHNMAKSSESVNEEVDLLHEGYGPVIDSFIKETKDRYGFPEISMDSSGVITQFQKSQDAREHLIEYLKMDPNGSFRKEYAARVEKGHLPFEGMDYDAWVDFSARNLVNSKYVEDYKYLDTSYDYLEAQIKANQEASTSRASLGFNEAGNVGSLDISYDALQDTDFDWDWDFGLSAESRGYFDYKAGAGPGGLVPTNTKTQPLTEEIVMSRPLTDDPKQDQLLKTAALLHDGIDVTDYDPSNYRNEDRTLTPRGVKAVMGLENMKKEVVKFVPTVRAFSEEDKERIAKALNIKEKSSNLNDLFIMGGKNDPVIMEITPTRKLGKMYSLEELRKDYGGNEDGAGDVRIVIEGYMEKKNPLPLLAMNSKKGGVADPWRWGIDPLVVRMVDTGAGRRESGDRTFIIPRDAAYAAEHPEKRAMNQIYLRAASGGGRQVPFANDEDHADMIARGIMNPARKWMTTDSEGNVVPTFTPQAHEALIRDISENVKSVELLGEDTYGKGPHSYSKEGDIGFVYERGGVEGSVSVSDFAGAPKVLAQVARNIVPNLDSDDTFMLHYEIRPDIPEGVYSLSINGGEPMQFEGGIQGSYKLHQALIDRTQALQTLTPDTKNLEGPYGELNAMKGLANTKIIMKFNDVFMDPDKGFRKFDYQLDAYNKANGKNIQYTVTSGLRPNDADSAHSKGRAIDLRHTPDLQRYFEDIIPEFRRSPDGEVKWYGIPGTSLMVALHNNMDPATNEIQPGYHFDIRYNIAKMK